MAQNLKVAIAKGESYGIPEMPIPWRVRIEWCEEKVYNEEAPTLEVIRTWSFDASSELIAKTLQVALNNMTDAAFDALMDAGYER